MTEPLTDTETFYAALRQLAESVWGSQAPVICAGIKTLIDHWQIPNAAPSRWLTEKDSILICYGDSIFEPGQEPLKTLKRFYTHYASQAFSAVHILPCFPYSSDDGFSVEDYHQINPELGDWDDIEALAARADIMLDAVINHISRWSYWFRRYESGDEQYRDYFISADPDSDYSQVTRPRTHPLLTEFETAMGKRWVWTTFSEDQIDLNFANPSVFLAILDVLITYGRKGARFVRLDAIGFLWKEFGTSCIHLPQTHTCIQICRQVLEKVCPDLLLITETNVPHKENISYFGNGYNEAHLVYQFPLPPLVLHAFISEKAHALSAWASGLEAPQGKTTFFNFLASHDGIGLRPTEGLLTASEKQRLVEVTLRHGGKVSWKDNGDGTKSPYELNISYRDALSHPDENHENKIKRMLAAHAILFSFQGMPAVYIHSFIGSGNDYRGVEDSNIFRRINRAQTNWKQLQDRLSNDETLASKIWRGISALLIVRRRNNVFSVDVPQTILNTPPAIFGLQRMTPTQTFICLVNVSTRKVNLDCVYSGKDLLLGSVVEVNQLEPLEFRWLIKS